MPRAFAPTRPRRDARRGAALVELVIMLPMLSFILVASTDFARAFHDLVTVTDCARNGSLYASRNPGQPASAYQAGIASAALADAACLGPSAAVSTDGGSLGTENNYVDVTVSSTFQTLTPYPGIPSPVAITRTIRMRVQPTTYRMR